jgi:hypothetical protein
MQGIMMRLFANAPPEMVPVEIVADEPESAGALKRIAEVFARE